MLRELYSNAAETLLSGAHNNSTTSIAVVDGSTFPLFNFRILVDSELMFCTSRSSNTLTVIRGVEGTSAVSHLSAVVVNSIITAGSFDAFRRDMFAAMGHGRVPTSGNTYGDEFDDESFSGWTAVNSGSAPTAVVTEQDKFCSILHPGGGASGQFLSWMKSTGTLTANDWISVCYRLHHISDGYPQFGLWFANGATYGAGVQAGLFYSPREQTFLVRGETNFNNQTSFTGASSGYTVDPNMALGHDIHLKFVYKGSNQFDPFFSVDGVSWQRMGTNVNPCTLTPTYVGFGFTTWGGSYPATATLRNFRTSF